MIPGVVVIAKQFEYGRKILNIVGKLKAKALNFIKDTYDLGKAKLTSAYNSLITKIDDFESSIIRQIDDVIRNSNKAVKFSTRTVNGTNGTVKFETEWLANMSPDDAERYIRWHEFADNKLIGY